MSRDRNGLTVRGVRKFSPEGGARMSGFTLVEMLVVLAIMALIGTVAIARFARKPTFAARAQVRLKLGELAAAARQQAGLSGQPTPVDLGALGPLSLVVVQPTLPSRSTDAPLIYYADGSSNGGIVLFAGRPLVEVNWLTGRVRDAAR